MQEKVTIAICLPKALEKSLTKEISNVYNQFGKFRLKGTVDGIYRNMPHITLLEMGACFEHREEIEQQLKSIVREFDQFKVSSVKLILFHQKEMGHIVFRVKKTRQLQELHNQIHSALKEFAEKTPPYSLKKFKPHLTIITYLPKSVVLLAKESVKLTGFSFLVEEIGIKVNKPNKKSKLYKKFSLAKK